MTIDLGALVANWRDLDARSRPGKAGAVVKANAYGLGVEQVVPALLSAGCDTYFVALVQEGIAVRALAPDAMIYVLNGIHEDLIDACRNANLVPILSSLAQIDLWCGSGGGSWACQVDTGMNRLGLTVEEALVLAENTLVDLQLIMSHFACADDPAHPLNARQIEVFQHVAAGFPHVESSLSNSAGIINGGAFGHHLTRPGIALYGGEAVNDIANPMRAVVMLEGRIMQIRHAKKGETVSYGATQRLARDSKIAIISVGYADGYPRAGSGAGVPLRDAVREGQCGFIGGHRVPVLGRITMDLTCFDVTDVPDAVLAAGWIELIGKNIKLDDAARAAGTIGYELLTGLSARYTRQYT